MKLKNILCSFSVLGMLFCQCQTGLAEDVITVHKNSTLKTWQNFTNVEYTLVQSGPKLLFSDSPEMVYNSGLLYRDKAKGHVRLFFHHVNAMNSPKKLAVVLKHNNPKGLEYQILKKGLSNPDYYWLKAGKDAEGAYFDMEKRPEPVKKVSYSGHDELLSGKGLLLNPNQLVTGILDLDLKDDAELTVFMCEPNTDISLFNERIDVQPLDEQPLRGTFEKADWNYKVKDNIVLKKEDVKMLCLADRGNFTKGIDSTTGLPAENYGNYGVVYNVDFTVSGDNNVNFYFAPMGGYYAGYGILSHNGKQTLMALPGDRVYFGELGEEWLRIGNLEKGDYRFIWSPAGSSNLPVSLVWEGM